MKFKTLRKIFIGTAFTLLALFNFTTISYAATLPCESATVTGHYRHPETNIIEDSAGEDNEALGQSMVGNVIDSIALLEKTENGNYLLSLRFNMMNSISDITLSTQEPGESQWQSVDYDTTDSGDDWADLRLSVESKATIVRAECFVEPMGRSVIFFITLDNFTSGNSGAFAQTDEADVPSTNNTNHSFDNETGLVIGGTSQNKEESTNNKTSETSEFKELKIGTDVWIMFFVLAFCAQILACIVFDIVKSLLFKKDNPKSKMNHYKRDDDEDDVIFSEELLDDCWEVNNDEEA